MTVAVDSAGRTHQGRVRTQNEDHFVVATMRKAIDIVDTSLDAGALQERMTPGKAYLFAVADGVGGRPGGELASEATVETLLRFVAQAAGCYHGLDTNQEHDLLERLERTVMEAHRSLLREYGDSDRAPATTLTMAMLVWPRTYLVHVGDSRAYYWRRGKLTQITRDQTIGEFMTSVGAWTEAQAAKSPTASSLASAIGGSEVTPSIGLIDLEADDVLVLCTDGLTKHVPDAELAEVVSSARTAAEAADELVKRALAGGGTSPRSSPK
jgi:protein phosphatase